jgi:hypothetical protein
MPFVADFPDTFRRAADDTDEILCRAKPGDLPVEAGEVRSGDQP